jgi:putative transposase
MTSLRLKLAEIRVSHLVADSAYATLAYLQSALQHKCYLISKFKSNAALYAPYEGQQKTKGPRRFYGDRIDLTALDEKHLRSTSIKGDETVKVYQFPAYSKAMSGILLNVVVIVTVGSNGKQRIAILFSNDTALDATTMIEYYSLRFQIEFEFRDAKQHFGLSDFKNYKKENLTTMVNMCFTMDIISKILLASLRKDTGNSKMSVLDLKILFHARFQAQNIIKLLRKKGHIISYSEWIEQYYPIDMINAE